MATITYDDGAVKTIGSAGLTTSTTGHGGSKGPVMSVATGKKLSIATGQISFDASYPTGGEDISDIFDLFPGGVVAIFVDPSVPMTSASTGKRLQVDYANKKLLLYDNAVATAQVANASSQTGSAAVRFVAFGYA